MDDTTDEAPVSAHSLESQLFAELLAAWRQREEGPLLDEASARERVRLVRERMVELTLAAIRNRFSVTGASIWLVDAETGGLVCRYTVGQGSDVVRGWRLPPGAGFAGWAAQHDQCLVISDAWADARYFRRVDEETGLKLHSILTVPLRGEAGVLGVFQIVDTEAERFGSSDLKMLKPLVTQLAETLSDI
jgi:GAF domain-containing protein